MAKQKQVDPSRTVTLRRAFARDMDRRWRKIRTDILEFISTRDVFGLSPRKLVIHTDVPPRGYEFRTDAEKIELFRQWLKNEVDENVLTTDSTGNPWLGQYIRLAYEKGKRRAYGQVFKGLFSGPESILATRDGRLLGVVFGGPVELRVVQNIYTRAWNDLQGISDTTGQQLSRILSNGFIRGTNPLEIAKEMVQTIDGMSRRRAELIARTEIIAAHAEGQLDSYAELAVPAVRVEAEWQTAGDNKVCPDCGMMEGRVLPIESARGLIPRHPLCRCAWVPVTFDEYQKARSEI